MWAVLFSVDVTVCARGLAPRVLPLMVGATVLTGVAIIVLEFSLFIVNGFDASTSRLIHALGEDAATVAAAVSAITMAAEGAVPPPRLAAVDGGEASRRSRRGDRSAAVPGRRA